MHKYYIFFGILSVIILLTIIIGFQMAGNPLEQQAKTLDTTRLSDFSELKYQVENYYRTNSKLPKNLTEIPPSSYIHFNDPKTKTPYAYNIISDMSYSFCTEFATESKSTDTFSSSLNHKKGYDCVTNTIPSYMTVTPTPTPYIPIYIPLYQIPTPGPIPTLPPVSTWKTFTNTEYQYSIRYPSDFNYLSTFPKNNPDPALSPFVTIDSTIYPWNISIQADYDEGTTNLSTFVNNYMELVNKTETPPLRIMSQWLINKHGVIIISNNDEDLKNLSLYAFVQRAPSNVMRISADRALFGTRDQYMQFFNTFVTNLSFP